MAGPTLSLCSWREPPCIYGLSRDCTGWRTNAHWKVKNRGIDYIYLTFADCFLGEKENRFSRVKWDQEREDDKYSVWSLASSESPRAWGLSCHLWGLSWFGLNNTILSADREFQHEPQHLTHQICVVDLVLDQRVFWGRAGQGRIFQSTLCSPPQLGCWSWPLPAQGGLHGGLLVTAQRDGWAAICEEQSQGLMSSAVNCSEAVFITRDIKSMAPCKAATAHPRAVRHFICLAALLWLITRGIIAFVTHSQVSGKGILPALHFQCPTYQLHPWCWQVRWTALFLSQGHFHSEKKTQNKMNTESPLILC